MEAISRSTAKKLGLTRYFTGRPCPKGHVASRFVTSRGCELCTTEYRNDNREKAIQASIRSRKKKRRYYNEYQIAWNKANPERVRAKENKAYANNPQFRLKKCLRARLKKAIGRNSKVGSAVRDLGCSIEFLKNYFDSMFHAGMTWDNHGSFWEIDHKIALSKFDLSDYAQLKLACHYTNLQPLLIEDHKNKTREDLYRWL